ncbi:MAG: FHA domain-containing protein [Gammaproteobacteria bacterium]|nr:FHA domain-containing protein [Gammaproteobacteria bacterium]
MSDDPQRHNSRDTDTGPQGTRVFRREDIRQHLEKRGAGSTGPADSASSAVLVGANGAFRGRRIDIPGGRSTLGRDATNNIIVNDDSVSLVHARLVEKSGVWRVLNLLSTNGTWVNNKKVSDGVLRDGDTVCFGQAEFVFHITGKPRPAGLWNRVRRWFGRSR